MTFNFNKEIFSAAYKARYNVSNIDPVALSQVKCSITDISNMKLMLYTEKIDNK